MTRIALFAADRMGVRIAEVFADRRLRPALLVVDGGDSRGVNREILAALGGMAERVLAHDAIGDAEERARLERERLEIGLLAWWPYIVKRSVIDLFSRGLLNLHPSLLPFGRGKDPNFWSLVEESPFGVTIHFVDEGIDSGDIAFQRAIPVSWEDTGQTLYVKAQDELVRLVDDSLEAICSGDIPRRPQPDGGTFHYRRELEPASLIDLDKSYRARDLLNLLRARTFPPHPSARFVDGEDTWEVRVHIQKVGKRGEKR